MSTLTALEGRLLKISPELKDVIAVLEVIQAATKIGGSGAAVALKIAESALDALEKNASGVVTDADLADQVTQAHADLAAARAGEDAELAAKFPGVA